MLAADLEGYSERDERHGGLTAADLPGSMEGWEDETEEATENRERARQGLWD